MRIAMLVMLAMTFPVRAADLSFPPKLTGDAEWITIDSPALIEPPKGFREGIAVAKTAPKVEVAYLPGQTYKGNPWSVWGDSVYANGKYYTAFGDHLAPQGNAFVYEFNPKTKKFRQLIDVRKLINLPDGHYTPGKIHSQLGMGRDGWLYFSTHRGSTRVTTDANHYLGDWLLRANPDSGKSEIVVHAPVAKHCLPTGLLDSKRLIFYAGTHPGNNDPDGIQFFAYDVANRKMLYNGPNGPARSMIHSSSTGRVYYVPTKSNDKLVRFDPEKVGPPVEIDVTANIRATSDETADGKVYLTSQPEKGGDAMFSVFDVKTEKIESLGVANVGQQGYITSLDIDATGRFIYYIPGAHGGAEKDGSPVVQFDTKNRTRKVIAFLHPVVQEKAGFIPSGTYSVALSTEGDKLFVTWNSNRGTKVWDTVTLSVIHIPASER